MKSVRCVALAALLGATAPAFAADESAQVTPSSPAASDTTPAVTVVFDQPEKYRDGGRLGRDDAKLKDIETFLQKMGAKYLPAHERLSIEVLDIDLAGEDRWGPRSNGMETRILIGRADWPSITLRYVLESDTQELARQEETVSDMNYLQHTFRPPADETLPYEKRMLEQWFRARFLPQGAAPRKV
jgi:hypothetical protein